MKKIINCKTITNVELSIYHRIIIPTPHFNYIIFLNRKFKNFYWFSTIIILYLPLFYFLIFFQYSHQNPNDNRKLQQPTSLWFLWWSWFLLSFLKLRIYLFNGWFNEPLLLYLNLKCKLLGSLIPKLLLNNLEGTSLLLLIFLSFFLSLF